MKSALLIFLTVCLTLSLGLNLYLLNVPTAPQTSTQTVQSNGSDNSVVGSLSSSADPLKPEAETSDPIVTIKNLLDQGNPGRALELVQAALRVSPQNIELLLLEADLLARKLGPADALANYYSLLVLPLNGIQRQTLTDKIAHLANFHIENLSRLKSWDILSDFLEPLWQFAPNERNYIVPLAEAYANQNLQAPMENVLASLYPDDPDVTRIRELLYQNRLTSAPETQPVPNFEDEEVVAQGTPLRQLGDHYIVKGQLNQSAVELMIDTGASTTVLTEITFNRLSAAQSSFIGQYRVNTAGGQVIAPVYRMQQLEIGGYQVNELAVVVLPMDDFNQADGLLGMNFLREFDFRIDQDNAQLFLHQRKP